MIRTYLKTLWRMFKRHAARFISLICMVLIAVGFCSGIGSATDKIDHSLTDYYKARNVSDFIIKSTTADGFTEDDIITAQELFTGAKVNSGNALDIETGEKLSVRYYFLDFGNWTVNVPDFIEGKMPEDENEVLVEIKDNVIKGFESDELEIDFEQILLTLAEKNGEEVESLSLILDRLQPKKVKISGIIQSPLTFANDGEPSYNNEEFEIPDTTSGTADMDCLENIIYISKDLIPSYKDLMSFLDDEPLIPTGEIYISLADKNVFNCFSPAYKTLIENGKAKILEKFENVEVITLYENYSFKSLSSYSNKVEGIGYILMAAFILVTTLVVLSTMTRLLDEERSQIACLKTLGYSSTGVISKYLLFALLATGIGGFGAYFVGLGMAYLLYTVFNYSFSMPPMSSSVAMVFYVITFVVIVAATLAATAIAGYRMANCRPAELLRPKPPRAGKKVIFERIPFIWNRLPFKYKSTVRNVLRYKSRFIMTVVAVAFSTALIMAGLGLLDMCLFSDFGSGAIMGISAVIVVFAGLLTCIVIYTLTNINISERNREIATLMVLGYYDREVCGYIYREVFINSLIGIIFGYPLSVLLMILVFATMGIGSVGGVSWFMWLAAPVIVMLFTGIVAVLLRRKIVKIHMNESLKAIE